MTALYVTGGILLFLFLVCLIKAEAVIAYGTDFSLTVRAAGIPVFRIPGRQKKVRPRDYTPKAMKKKAEKARKAALAKAKKAEKKEKKKAERKAREKEMLEQGAEPKKKDIVRIIKLISGLLGVLLKRFGKHIRIKIAKLHVRVATGDAASTAVVYGYVIQAASYLTALLERSGTLVVPGSADVDISPDFVSESVSCDIVIGISLRVWQVLDMIFRTGAKFIKELIKSNGQLF